MSQHYSSKYFHDLTHLHFQDIFAQKKELAVACVRSLERAAVVVEKGELVVVKYAVGSGIRTDDEPLSYAVARVEDTSSPLMIRITWFRQMATGNINSLEKKSLLASLEKGRHVEVKDKALKHDDIDRESILLTGVVLTANGHFSKQRFKREGNGPTTSTLGQLTELVEAGVLCTTPVVDAEAKREEGEIDDNSAGGAEECKENEGEERKYEENSALDIAKAAVELWDIKRAGGLRKRKKKGATEVGSIL